MQPDQLHTLLQEASAHAVDAKQYLFAEYTVLPGNEHYTLLAYLFLLDQYRIQITDRRLPDEDAPAGHGQVVQELCTYDQRKAVRVLLELRDAPDPLALARSWATTVCQELRNLRIRLDTTAEMNPYRGKR